MPLVCTPNDLLPLAAVMRGMSQEQRSYVNTYLLAVMAGVEPDPDAILESAKCFRCVPEQKLKEMSAWLLCNVAGGVTPPADCSSLSGAGDPTGVTTPEFSGQLYHRTGNDTYYRSTGTTSADWVAISGGAAYQDMQIGWTPTNLKLGEIIQFQSYDAIAGITSLTFNQDFMRFAPFLDSAQEITTVNFPNLVSVGGGYDFNIRNFPALTSVSFSALTTLLDDFQISGNTLLTSISIPVFASLHSSASLFFENNPALVNFTFPSFIPVNGNFLAFAGNALSAASVNHILARAVAAAGYNSGGIELTGGTTSAPTGQGILDKATLLGRGLTCNTN